MTLTDASMPNIRWFQYILVLLLALIVASHTLIPSVVDIRLRGCENDSLVSSRIYALQVNTIYENSSMSYHGIQNVTFDYSTFPNITGYISWNLTWDAGKTWQFLNTTNIFYTNRTYFHIGVQRLTAWWINPNLQPGDQVFIDGDPPVTNNLPRIAPFQVADLTSLTLNPNTYLCWILVYQTDHGQTECFYYEYQTGVLLLVESTQIQPRQTHQMHLQLVSAFPSLPQTLTLDEQTTYALVLIAISIGVLVLLVVILKRRHSPSTTNNSSAFHVGQNA